MKNFFENLFFGEHLRLCPWSLALALSIPVLGLKRVCPSKGCPWPCLWPRIFFVSLALASNFVSSTPPLVVTLLDIRRLMMILSLFGGFEQVLPRPLQSIKKPQIRNT